MTKNNTVLSNNGSNNGADIGNYSTGIYNEFLDESLNITQPSIVAFSSSVFDKSDEPLAFLIEHLNDNIKVHIQSDINSINSFYYVGNSAININSDFKRYMDISSNSKADNDIPVIMLLSLFSIRSIKSAFLDGFMSEDVKEYQFEETLNLTTAIPASEFSTAKAQFLENKFKGSHVITVYFGEYKVTVNLKFDFVKVTEEGKTSMLYLSNLEMPEKKYATESYMNYYNKELLIDDDTYSLHVDIGNGTTEITFIKGATPIVSKGINMGVGHAILQAITVFSNKLNATNNLDRQAFELLLDSNKNKGILARECLYAAKEEFAKSLLNEISVAINTLTNSQMEYLFVHGGGSIRLRENLEAPLLKMTESNLAELVYIAPEYATQLNARGCYQLCKLLNTK